MNLTSYPSNRRGFTLVEIMIVVAIIALLASIAVPNFMRARKRSQATRILEDLRVLDSQVARLEGEIDQLNDQLEPLTSFVLPGGSPAAAALHVCRTVCRRAERVGVRLTEAEDESVSPAALKYLNRLSDLLFVAARFANAKGAADVLWRPGATR